jgi:cellulose synthase/poly-beta-1,6-N-acetylglucosamine synthase-like glycosyltransferase
MKAISIYNLLASGFWIALGATVYTYIGYPLWIYLRSRLHPVPWRQAQIEPSVSVIMAVHNGTELLSKKIDHLLELDYPQDRIEIIIVSDGSTDGTNRILEAIHHPRIKPVICDEHRGKAAALNACIARAQGEILVFVDARPWLQANALRFLVSNFADPKVGCVGGNLIPVDDGQDAGMKAVSDLYWRMEQWIRNREAQVYSAIGVVGAFYAIRRELVTALPGGIILDDLLQSLNIIRQGYRCVFDARACVYDTWPKKSRNEFSRKVRTLAGNFQLLQMAPWVLSRQNSQRVELISHKFLRLLVPVLLLIMLVTSAFLANRSSLFEIALIAQAGMYILAMLGAGRSIPILKRIAGPANAFCMLNAAVIVGFYRLLFTRGPLWKIWVTTGTSGAAES